MAGNGNIGPIDAPAGVNIVPEVGAAAMRGPSNDLVAVRLWPVTPKKALCPMTTRKTGWPKSASPLKIYQLLLKVDVGLNVELRRQLAPGLLSC